MVSNKKTGAGKRAASQRRKSTGTADWYPSAFERFAISRQARSPEDEPSRRYLETRPQPRRDVD